MSRSLLYKLNNTIENIAFQFLTSYFSDEEWEFYGEFYFLENDNDRLNSTLQINDYFFNLEDIYTALWYDIPPHILLERYDKKLEYDMKKNKKGLKKIPNLKNFYLYSLRWEKPLK